MPDISTDVKMALGVLIVGIIFVFIGMTAASIAGGVGYYVVSKLNDSLKGAIPGNINQFSSDNISMLSTVFLFTGIALLVFAVAIIIRSLLASLGEIKTQVGALTGGA